MILGENWKYSFQRVNQFIYLFGGANINEINLRITKGNGKFGTHQLLKKVKILFKKGEDTKYITLGKTITMGMRNLRALFGRVRTPECWRRSTKKVIKMLYVY